MPKTWKEFDYAFIPPKLIEMTRSLRYGDEIYFKTHNSAQLFLLVIITKLKMLGAREYQFSGIEVTSGDEIGGSIKYNKDGFGGIACVSIFE